MNEKFSIVKLLVYLLLLYLLCSFSAKNSGRVNIEFKFELKTIIKNASSFLMDCITKSTAQVN